MRPYRIKYWNTMDDDVCKWVDLDQVVAITEPKPFGDVGIQFSVEMMMRDEPVRVLSRADKDPRDYHADGRNGVEIETARLWQPLFDAWAGKAESGE